METLVINPFNSGLAQPVLIMLSLVFGGFGAALLVLQFNNGLTAGKTRIQKRQGTPIKVLWQRYRTWAIIAILFGGAGLCGALPLAGLCAFLVWQAGREYAALTNLPTLHRNFMILGGWLTIGAILIFGASVLNTALIIAFFGMAALALFPLEGETEVGERLRPMLSGLWGYVYIGWLPAHLLALSVNNQVGLVLVVGLGVALSDVGAFCVGKTVGGAKLAPRLSPNKTWGGVIGNFVGAALALALIAFALPALQWWQFGLLVTVIAIGSVWGDLLESLLKRQSGVKDAGAWLPGFGGLLDRIDSLLLVAPLVYYFWWLFLK